MAAEGRALFGNLAQVRQGKHLEAAAVGQDGMGPIHEGMQPARFLHNVLAGAEMEMIGVGQNDFRAQLLHFPRSHGLHGRLGANGHVNGRGDIAVRGMHHAQPRPGLLTGFNQFKGNRIAHEYPRFSYSWATAGLI